MPVHSVLSARRCSSSGRPGLTLVELLVAVTILAVALAAYLKVALISRAAMDKGNYFTIASRLAGDTLADYQGLGYSGMPLYGTTASNTTALPKGVITVTIGPLDGSAANANITQIDVTVTWGLTNSKLPQEAGSVKQSLLVSAP